MIAIEVGIAVSLIAYYFDLGLILSLIFGSASMFLCFLISKCFALRH